MKAGDSPWNLPLAVVLVCQLLVRRTLGLTFTYPVENGLIFYDGETIDVSWTSKISNVSLMLFCRNETESGDWVTSTVSNIGYVDTVGSKLVDVEFSVSSDYCWFNVFETGNQTNGVNSVTFVLSSNYHSGTTLGVSGVATTSYGGTGVPTGPVTASTSVSSSITASITGTITTRASSATREAATSSSSASSSSGSSLSSGAKAGIGVGVSVGALVLVGAAVYWFVRRRKSAGPKAELSGAGIAAPAKGFSYEGAVEIGADTERAAELDAERRERAELP